MSLSRGVQPERHWTNPVPAQARPCRTTGHQLNDSRALETQSSCFGGGGATNQSNDNQFAVLNRTGHTDGAAVRMKMDIPAWEYWQTTATFGAVLTVAAAGIFAFFTALQAAQQARDSAAQVASLEKTLAGVRDLQTDVRGVGGAIGIPAMMTPEQKAARDQAAEDQRRSNLLQGLRNQFIASHDGISSEMMAGMAWPPDDWMNEQLEKLGETFRVTADGPTLRYAQSPLTPN